MSIQLSVIKKNELFNDAQLKLLPEDLKEVVGKVRLVMVDAIANIKAFFVILCSGGLRNFRESINDLARSYSSDLKLHLYMDLKKIPIFVREFMLLTGYRVFTLEDIERLKRADKDFIVYQVFKAVGDDKDFDKTSLLLKKIENNNRENYPAVIVSLNKLIKIKDIPQSIKDLISSKSKALSSEDNVKYFTQKVNEQGSPLWKKVVIWSCVAASVAGLGYAVFEVFGPRAISQLVPKQELSKGQQHTLASPLVVKQASMSCPKDWSTALQFDQGKSYSNRTEIYKPIDFSNLEVQKKHKIQSIWDLFDFFIGNSNSEQLVPKKEKYSYGKKTPKDVPNNPSQLALNPGSELSLKKIFSDFFGSVQQEVENEKIEAASSLSLFLGEVKN